MHFSALSEFADNNLVIPVETENELMLVLLLETGLEGPLVLGIGMALNHNC